MIDGLPLVGAFTLNTDTCIFNITDTNTGGVFTDSTPATYSATYSTASSPTSPVSCTNSFTFYGFLPLNAGDAYQFSTFVTSSFTGTPAPVSGRYSFVFVGMG